MNAARINGIRDNSQEQINWLRNCTPGQLDLRVQVGNTQLHSLLGLSLLAAKKHSELFITIDDSPITMGSDTHLEETKTTKVRAGELITQLDEALRYSPPAPRSDICSSGGVTRRRRKNTHPPDPRSDVCSSGGVTERKKTASRTASRPLERNMLLKRRVKEDKYSPPDPRSDTCSSGGVTDTRPMKGR